MHSRNKQIKDLESEIWKDVIGYEGLYQASNMGRIKSLPRSWIANNNLSTSKLTILYPRIIRGYYSVALGKNSTKKRFTVHRLVYESFFGKTDLYIDHIKEGNRLDNRIENLQAISARENTYKYMLTSTKSSSKHVGVYWVAGRNVWRAVIFYNGSNRNLGSFKNELDAHFAYQFASTRLYLGKTNFRYKT